MASNPENPIKLLNQLRKEGFTDEQISKILKDSADPTLKIMMERVEQIVRKKEEKEGKREKPLPGDNPVDRFNRSYTPEELIGSEKSMTTTEEGHVFCCDELYLERDGSTYTRVKSLNNPYGINVGAELNPFQVMTAIRFSNNYRNSIQYVEFKYMNRDVPYIRVRTNYFKRIQKRNNWGVKVENIVPWSKEAIKDDHGTKFLNRVNLYDDFTIDPSNTDYQPIVRGMWNLYEPFPHQPHPEAVDIDMMPRTASFMAHVFGEQLEIGYKYIKVLYENPKQILPVLVLVSKERNTGKSSFLNWMDIIFANNYTMISPEDLNSAFNSQYAYRNIIGIDEAVIDRQSAVEKIKSVVTARTILVNQKMIAQYRIPFYGKIIITTNRETDFMRVDDEEIRFWVRKLDTIPEDDLTASFYEDLRDEVPLLLRYLIDMEPIEYGQSRMVFTAAELSNEQLETVKRESRSNLFKELQVILKEWFEANPRDEVLYMRLKDIKDAWFDRDSRTTRHYINKVLMEEMNMEPEQMGRYRYNGTGEKQPGTPFKFNRSDYTSSKVEQAISGHMDDELPF